jgi:DNA polymerase I
MRTLLLDGDVLLHRACAVASTKIDWGDGEVAWSVNVPEAAAWLKEEVRKLRRRLEGGRVIVALGDRKANFRKELTPTYKAHRNTTPKPPGFLDLEELVVKNAQVVREDRLEGDDMLGLLLTKEPLDGKVCVSIDKDMLQVPGTHYNPDKDELTEVDEETAHRRHLTQALTGDRVDGYPGCPGVGWVKAARILVGEPETWWERIVTAFEKAGKTEDDALLQARLAFVLRQGWYSREKKEVRLWKP